jgi:hypothetical protein
VQRALGVCFQVARLLLTLIAVSAGSLAQAQDPKRIVVLDFEGSGAAGPRTHVVNALGERSELTLVPAREAESAANRLGASLDKPADLVRVAEDLQISVFVGGSLRREGGKFRVTVWVRDGSTGKLRHEETWTRKKKPQLKAIQGSFWSVMGPHIEASSAPAQSAPRVKKPEPTPAVADAPEQPGDKEDDEEHEEPGTPSKRPALIASIGPRVLGRNLVFRNDELGNLRSYEIKAAMEVAVSAQWYPGAHFRDDWLANFGLDLDGDYAIGLKSKDNGKERRTTAYELGGGLIVRLPLEMFEPRLRVGYVRQVFTVNTPSTVLMPSMTYGSVRMGAGTAVKIIDALSLDVGLAYLHVLSAEELTGKDYFPRASVGAFEAGGGVLVRIMGPFAARAGVDWRRYFFDLKPRTGAQVQADSAKDDYLRYTLSFVYMLGQKGQ